MGKIVVPELGESILEGTLLNWLKEVGDRVETGEAVAELETDKVNLEVMAEEAGVLESQLKSEGDTVAVGEAIGTVSTSGSGAGPTATKDTSQTAGAHEERETDRAAGTTTGEAPHPHEAGERSANEPKASESPSMQAPHTPSSDTNGQDRSTPAIRRLAKEQGVDLSRVQGTGGMGRVTEEDVLREKEASGPAVGGKAPALASRDGNAKSPAVESAGAKGNGRGEERRERMSRRRLTIAKRLLEVKQTTAMLTTFNEIDMTKMLDLRQRHKDRFKEENDIGLGFMSFFSKATVAALKKFPRLNAEIDGDDMILKDHYDIGIAVSTEGGLVVPVVRDADRLSFAQIEREIARLAEKARSNALQLADLQGGTFTITNGGVFGSLFSTPILNAPQVGILGMHGIQERPVAVNGEVVIHKMMYVALSYDHRIVDGAEAVSFLVEIKKLIEDPERLMLQG